MRVGEPTGGSRHRLGVLADAGPLGLTRPRIEGYSQSAALARPRCPGPSPYLPWQPDGLHPCRGIVTSTSRCSGGGPRPGRALSAPDAQPRPQASRAARRLAPSWGPYWDGDVSVLA